jgi:hypothetical protein
MYQDELQYELAHDLVLSSTFLASLDLLQFLPVGIRLVKLLQTSQPSATNLNCAEKSSLVSSSSQLSSHRCVLSPGTSVSSCVQSVIIWSLTFPFLVHRVPPKGSDVDGIRHNILSTGKSSNSSSSSNAAAGFTSFDESALFSDDVALVVGTAPAFGAADMIKECEMDFEGVISEELGVQVSGERLRSVVCRRQSFLVFSRFCFCCSDLIIICRGAVLGSDSHHSEAVRLTPFRSLPLPH